MRLNYHTIKVNRLLVYYKCNSLQTAIYQNSQSVLATLQINMEMLSQWKILTWAAYYSPVGAHISCIMCTGGLSDMHTLIHQASGVHIRQIMFNVNQVNIVNLSLYCFVAKSLLCIYLKRCTYCMYIDHTIM